MSTAPAPSTASPGSPPSQTLSPNTLPKPKKKSSKPFIGWIARRLGRRSTSSHGAEAETARPHQKQALEDSTVRRSSKRRSTLNGATPPAIEVPPPMPRRPTHSMSGPVPPRTPSLSNGRAQSELSSIPRSSSRTPSPRPSDSGSHLTAQYVDEDASIRPIAPRHQYQPTSSAGSDHSVAYTASIADSTGKTFRSGITYASTKPTTLFSVDGGDGDGGPGGAGGGAPLAHIAEASSHSGQRESNGYGGPRHSASISFSALPPASPNQSSPGPSQPNHQLVQPPHFSRPHPSNNPRPASPPGDNASVLTLASSNAAGYRHAAAHSQRKGSVHSSIQVYGDGGGRPSLDDADADASVRALRPHSRRPSADSTASSKWSAAVPLGLTTVATTPSEPNFAPRPPSLHAPSVRTSHSIPIMSSPLNPTQTPVMLAAAMDASPSSTNHEQLSHHQHTDDDLSTPEAEKREDELSRATRRAAAKDDDQPAPAPPHDHPSDAQRQPHALEHPLYPAGRRSAVTVATTAGSFVTARSGDSFDGRYSDEESEGNLDNTIRRSSDLARAEVVVG